MRAAPAPAPALRADLRLDTALPGERPVPAPTPPCPLAQTLRLHVLRREDPASGT